MKLTRNFKLKEFLVSSSHPELMEHVHVPRSVKWNLFKLSRILMQNIRDLVGQPIVITSGYRTEELNKLVGGAPASQHLFGEACDFYVVDEEGNKDEKATKRAVEVCRQHLHFAVGQCLTYYNKDGSLRHVHVSLPDPRVYNQFKDIKE